MTQTKPSRNCKSYHPLNWKINAHLFGSSSFIFMLDWMFVHTLDKIIFKNTNSVSFTQ